MSDAENDAYIFFTEAGKIKGGGTVDIQGESFDSKPETWSGYASEIQSITFGVASEGKTGTTEEALKVEVKDVQITKFTDWATAKYVMAMVTGAEFPKATILLRSNFREYLRIELKRVTVKSVDFSQSGSDWGTDTINLEFAEFSFMYSGIKPPEDLTADSKYSTCDYNKKTNKAETVSR